ncbi:MAG: GAF domain-containing protein [Desulfobacteraceae bacterium]
MSVTDKLDLNGYQLMVEVLSQARNLTALGGELTQLLGGAMGIKGTSIFILNPRSEELEVLASEGLSMDYVKKGPILVDRSIALPRNREPVIIEDISQSDALQYPEKARAEGIRSIVSMPVKAGSSVIGALRLYHSQVWAVTDQEKVLLTALAANLGVALRYFRLHTVVRSMKETMDEIHPVWL